MLKKEIKQLHKEFGIHFKNSPDELKFLETFIDELIENKLKGSGETISQPKKTMRFKIKDEGKEPKEEIVELYLGRERDEVSLFARNQEDEKALIIFRDGKFRRVMYAEIDGIETDKEGRIEEV